MPLPEFTEEERAEVIQAIRAAIDGDRYVLSSRVRRLKSALALAKLPATEAIRNAEPGLPAAEGRPATALADRRVCNE